MVLLIKTIVWAQTISVMVFEVSLNSYSYERNASIPIDLLKVKGLNL